MLTGGSRRDPLLEIDFQWRAHYPPLKKAFLHARSRGTTLPPKNIFLLVPRNRFCSSDILHWNTNLLYNDG
jgi:hypothetical protein